MRVDVDVDVNVDVDVRYLKKTLKEKQNKTKRGPTARLVIDPTSRRISRVLLCFVLLAREIDVGASRLCGSARTRQVCRITMVPERDRYAALQTRSRTRL